MAQVQYKKIDKKKTNLFSGKIQENTSLFKKIV